MINCAPKGLHLPLVPLQNSSFYPFSSFSKPPFHPKNPSLGPPNYPKIPSKPYMHPGCGLISLLSPIVTLSYPQNALKMVQKLIFHTM